MLRLGPAKQWLLFLVLIGSSPSAIADLLPTGPSGCAELLTGDVVAQLARLRFEIYQTKDPALRERLRADFENKILELQRTSALQGLGMLQQLRLKLKSLGLMRSSLELETGEGTELSRQEAVLGRKRVQFDVHLLTDIPGQNLTQWDASHFRLVPRAGLMDTGVMWSGDDRYVAIRPQAIIAGNKSSGAPGVASSVGLTQIYDLQTKQRLKFSPLRGVMSRQGNLWAYVSDGHTIITDFVTDQVIARVPGELDLERGPFLENSFFVRVNTKIFWHHLQKGSFDIGYSYGYSLTKGRLAYLQDGRLRVVDLVTGEDVPLPRQWVDLQGSLVVTGRPDYFVFAAGPKYKILMLDDLSVYDVPDADPVFYLVPGTLWVNHPPSNSARRTEHTLTHLITRQKVTLGPSVYRTGVRGLMLYDDPGDTRSLVSFDPVNKRKFDFPATEISRDGRWLIAAVPVGDRYHYTIQDLKTDELYQFTIWGRAAPILGTELWTFLNFETSVAWVGRLGDSVTEPAILGRGIKNLPAPSRTGKYYLGIRDGNVAILQTKQ